MLITVLTLALLAGPVQDAVGSPVSEAIARGRDLLAKGRAVEAQAVFEQAAELDPDPLGARAWVLRSWLPQGRINDALDAAQEIQLAGNEGPMIDYLYGMGFATKARRYVEQEVEATIVGMVYDDALVHLKAATAADAKLFRDAFFPLAEAAWHKQQLDLARDSAERAVRFYPDGGREAFLLGRIALAQFVAKNGDPMQAESALAEWERAVEAFRSVKAGHELAPRAQLELAHAYVWRQELDLARAAYSQAMSADETLVDFSQVMSAIGRPRFHEAVEAARARAEGPRPLLSWWLGYARFQAGEYAAAETAFEEALSLRPEYTNSWFYLTLARYRQEELQGATLALRTFWQLDPQTTVSTLTASADEHLTMIDALVAHARKKGQLSSAAVLSAIQAAVSPTTVRYWNNAGLFFRHAGEQATNGVVNEEQERKAMAFFERSFEAYSTALELAPEDPALVNDTAVILHYFLKRDLERAREMYEGAALLAERELARPELEDDRRELCQRALHDARANLQALKESVGSDG